MNTVDALAEVFSVLTGSHPFSGGHPLYGQVEFVPEYQLGEVSIPRVTFDAARGSGAARGLGTHTRVTSQRYQVDVLADTSLEAQRIYQRVVQAIMADYENDDGSGVIGRGYLLSKHIKSVVFDEPSSAPWDDAGRVKRVTGGMAVQFLKGV
jgi:hypothetical protein